MGAKGNYPRAIVMKMNDVDKGIVWAHVHNLKGKTFSVNNQMPRELSERKKQMVPLYKTAQ